MAAQQTPAPKIDGIPEEFWVNRQGKWFILYAGLLGYAHKLGLKKIETNLIQIPNEQTNRVAIMMATVTMQDDRTFTGFGDAAPNNVAPAMQTCLLRMAETRSKARALRDAVNIGCAAYEELQEEETGQQDEDRSRSTKQASTAKSAPTPLHVVNGGAIGEAAEQSENTAGVQGRAEDADIEAQRKAQAKERDKNALANFTAQARQMGYLGEILPLARNLCRMERPNALALETALQYSARDWNIAMDSLEPTAPTDTLDMNANVPTAASIATIGAMAR